MKKNKQVYGRCLLLFLALGACSSGKPQAVSYVNSEGKKTSVETDYESCVKSCNADYARCAEQGRSYMGTYGGGESQDATRIYGSGAACQDDLKKCLPRCKGR